MNERDDEWTSEVTGLEFSKGSGCRGLIRVTIGFLGLQTINVTYNLKAR